MNTKKKISPTDIRHLSIIRKNVLDFMKYCAAKYISSEKGQLLDIAPQEHTGASPFFPAHISIETLDIDPDSESTFIADMCRSNRKLIPDEIYDYIVCTEVLEHTLQPFDAIREIKRILKPNGFLFLTCPFNFRIHGPLPDCWRFTEHGLRSILSSFEIIELKSIKTPGRFLMPIHYTVVAIKPKSINSSSLANRLKEMPGI